MKMSFHRTYTEDNLELCGVLYQPEYKTDKIVINFHGMAGNFYENLFIDFMSNEFTKGGFAFLSTNNRGHDMFNDTASIKNNDLSWKKIGAAFEIFEECIYDIKAWIDFAEKLGFKEIFIQGHSLGAVKVTYYLSETGDSRIKGLILLSPPDMLGLHLGREEDKKKWEESMKLAKKLIGEGKGNEILPNLIWDWYYLSANTFMNFSKLDSKTNTFPFYKPNSGFKELSQIKCPMIAIFGSKDDAIVTDPKKCLKILKEKAVSTKICSTFIIDGAPHSYRNHEQELAAIVRKWLERVIK